jgi:hypothetical protein
VKAVITHLGPPLGKPLSQVRNLLLSFCQRINRSQSAEVILRCGRLPPRMSALGQKQTFSRSIAMSALPPKADIVQHGGNVRFVPKADIAARRYERAGSRQGQQ